MCVRVCVCVWVLGLTDDDLAPLELDGGVVEVVDEFKHLGSLVEACSGVVGEVNFRIAQALVVSVILYLLHQI